MHCTSVVHKQQVATHLPQLQHQYQNVCTRRLFAGLEREQVILPHMPHLDILIAATRGKKPRWVKVDRIHRFLVVPYNLHRLYAHVDQMDSAKQDPTKVLTAASLVTTTRCTQTRTQTAIKRRDDYCVCTRSGLVFELEFSRPI